MKCLAVSAFLLATFNAAFGQPPTVEDLTLESALNIALKNNYQLRTAELEVLKAADRTAAYHSRRYPSINANLIAAELLTKIAFQFPAGAFGVYSATGPIPAQAADISTNRKPITLAAATVMQPLTQLRRVNLSVRIGELGEELARMRVQSQRQTVVNDVKKLYYGMVQTQTGLDTVEEALKFLHEFDRVVAQYVTERVALRSDSLEVKGRVLRTESQRLQLRHALDTQREQLNLLMGRDVRTDFRVVRLPDPSPYETDLRAAQTSAMEHRPELRESRLKQQQAEYDRKSKQAEYLPDVSLMFGYISPFGVAILPKNIAVAGVSLQWEVFDWGRKKHEVAEKARTVEQASLAIKQTESAVLLEVASSFRKLEENRMQVQIAELSQETAKEQLRVAKTRYEEKSVLLRDVLQQQAAVADADGKYQQALLGFWTSRADFERAIGEEK